jgi:lysine 2,3-aminomutase
VWQAPNVKPGQIFTYFDPIRKLPTEIQERYKNEKERNLMIEEVIKKSGLR